MEDRCVCCGEIIPEGFQICHVCLDDYEQIEYLLNWINRKKEKKSLFKNICTKLKTKAQGW